jgi:hypothetical protein
MNYSNRNRNNLFLLPFGRKHGIMVKKPGGHEDGHGRAGLPSLYGRECRKKET